MVGTFPCFSSRFPLHATDPCLVIKLHFPESWSLLRTKGDQVWEDTSPESIVDSTNSIFVGAILKKLSSRRYLTELETRHYARNFLFGEILCFQKWRRRTNGCMKAFPIVCSRILKIWIFSTRLKYWFHWFLKKLPRCRLPLTCHHHNPPGGGTPGNSWWGCAAWFPKSWPYFRPRNVIFQTRFRPNL